MTSHDVGAAEGLALVGALIDGGAKLRGWLVDDNLTALGFERTSTLGSQRLVVGPGGSPFSAEYRFETWQAPGRGRVTWFSLDSEIPHMSTIVACVCTPCQGTGLPLFVMNLNLKLKAGTYNTIMGYRGTPELLTGFRTVFSAPGETPALVKKNPRTFEGVRRMYWLRRAPIDSSLALARRCLGRWLAPVAANPPDRMNPLAHDERYAQEMITLHSREGGGVYDAVFGPGWLSGLFRDEVFE